MIFRGAEKGPFAGSLPCANHSWLDVSVHLDPVSSTCWYSGTRGATLPTTARCSKHIIHPPSGGGGCPSGLIHAPTQVPQPPVILVSRGGWARVGGMRKRSPRPPPPRSAVWKIIHPPSCLLSSLLFILPISPCYEVLSIKNIKRSFPEIRL